MTDPIKANTEPRKHTVLWRPEDWERIEQAAKVISDREHIEVAPVDLIRGSTMRRVDEILGAVA